MYLITLQIVYHSIHEISNAFTKKKSVSCAVPYSKMYETSIYRIYRIILNRFKRFEPVLKIKV